MIHNYIARRKHRNKVEVHHNIALLSWTKQHIQTKTDNLTHEAERVGLKVNVDKCKLLRINSRSNDAVEVNGQGKKMLIDSCIWGLQCPKKVEAHKTSTIG